MSSSRGLRTSGFTVIEVLVGLLVTSLLIMAVAPMWVGLERRGSVWNDRVVVLLQTRVAAARLERDLRLIATEACPGLRGSALLDASASNMVFVTSAAEGVPEIVKWEFTGGSLMRRRVPWPGYMPSSFGTGTFIDHKTMMERVAPGAKFIFYQGSAEVLPPIPAEGRAYVDRIAVTAEVGTISSAGASSSVSAPGAGTVTVTWAAEVGR